MNLTELKVLLAEKLSCSTEESDVMLSAIIQTLKEYAKNLDSVAIPGFGTLSCAKIDEHIVENTQTAQAILTPPQIKLSFKTSVVLKKKFVG